MDFKELSFLCGLLNEYRPTKLVSTVTGNRTMTKALLNCIQTLGMACQIYFTESEKGEFQAADCHLDGEIELQKVSSDRPFPAWLDEIGDEVDFLILDAAERTPMELLDFLAVFPHLKQNAVVAIQDSVRMDGKGSRTFASSLLMQNITANRFFHHQELYPDIEERIMCCSGLTTPRNQINSAYKTIISGFQINKETLESVGDLFAVLHTEWIAAEELQALKMYDSLISSQYSLTDMHIYRRAVLKAYMAGHQEQDFKQYAEYLDQIIQYEDFLLSLCSSLFQSFQQILIYGSGPQGIDFLHFAKKVGVHIGGFVVTDGYRIRDVCCGLPVYEYSEIPFDKKQTLMIQAVDSSEVEERLRQSGYYWMKLSQEIWHKKYRMSLQESGTET